MIRLAFITNEPPPYRLPVFRRVSRVPGIAFQVIFCTRREPNRHWNLPPPDFGHVFLRERVSTVKGRYIHNNPDVLPALKRFAPDVVITDQFNPTHLYAFLYAWTKGLIHIPMTDGTLLSEQALSAVHRAVRRLVYRRSHAFISASMGGQKLYESYGISPERCFKSYLCIDNEAYFRTPAPDDPPYDFIFCARMVPEKGPLFALTVAQETARRLGRKLRILFVGSGSEEERVKAAATEQRNLVEAEFHGFAQQHELPALYRSARVFLFPTHADVWGVVANEACAAGLPVIVTPHAGVAGELVLEGDNGFIRELEVSQWAECAATLLTRHELRNRFGQRSLALVREYSFDNAANGVLDACRFALETRDSVKISKPV